MANPDPWQVGYGSGVLLVVLSSSDELYAFGINGFGTCTRDLSVAFGTKVSIDLVSTIPSPPLNYSMCRQQYPSTNHGDPRRQLGHLAIEGDGPGLGCRGMESWS